MCCRSSRYCTVQFRWVQMAENALNSPVEVRTSIPGRLPNLKILAELGLSSFEEPASTLFCCDSLSAGGIKNRITGYAIDNTVAPRLVLNKWSMNERLVEPAMSPPDEHSAVARKLPILRGARFGAGS